MTSMMQPPRPAGERPDPHEPEELSEAEFVHTLRMAVVVGVPAVFALLVVMMLLATGAETGFVLGAMWPAIVGGPFFAGFVYLSREQARHDKVHHHAASAGTPTRQQARIAH